MASLLSKASQNQADSRDNPASIRDLHCPLLTILSKGNMTRNYSSSKPRVGLFISSTQRAPDIHFCLDLNWHPFIQRRYLHCKKFDVKGDLRSLLLSHILCVFAMNHLRELQQQHWHFQLIDLDTRGVHIPKKLLMNPTPPGRVASLLQRSGLSHRSQHSATVTYLPSKNKNTSA
jgi:hypothetical protein